MIEIDIPELEVSRISRECDVQLYEFNDQVDQYLKDHPEAPFETFKEIVDTGKLYPHIVKLRAGSAKLVNPKDHPDYLQKLAHIDRNRETVLAIMDEYDLDALTYPHQQILVEEIDSFSQAGRNGIIASILAFPSICVPAGYSLPDESAPLGVPIGLEFVARPNREDLLFELAYAFEQKNPNRKPPRSTL